MRKHWAMLATLLCLAGGQELAWADFLPLGDLPGGLFLSRASGVSADGSIVVGESVSTSGFEAFRWTPGEDLLEFGRFRSASAGIVCCDVVELCGASLAGEF